jgi:hypothetical protein
MGEDFARLHPMLQRRFGVGLEAGYGCVGTGVMSSIRRGPWWTLPFLHLGRVRNILIPDIGTDVPFTIRNFPYLDPWGRETITFAREYTIRQRLSRFDATMILHAGQIVDYLGTHQHLAVDLQLRAEPDGSLLLTTHAQRFHEGPIGFTFPLLFSGTAVLRESWDPAINAFRVHLSVTNKVFGFLFGYDGTFTCEYLPATDAPPELKPVRHERRT